MKSLGQKTKAFTIVELLVVIVVIGILAAITIVSYTGIREKAVVSSIKAQLTMDSKILKMYYIDHGVYPSALDVNYCPTAPAVDNQYCIKNMNGSTLTYTGGGSSFTLTIKSGTISYNISEDGNIAQSSSSPISFLKTYGGTGIDYANAIIQTSDGGYAIAGQTKSYGSGDNDAVLAKYTQDGTLLWAKTWGGTGYDRAASLIQTSDQDYIITGETDSYGAGGSDVFVAKYTIDGTLSWSKTWGGISPDSSYEIIKTNDNSFAVIGSTMSYAAGGTAVVLIKYNPDGTVAWNKTWGGTGVDTAYGLVQDTNNDYVITGQTRSYSVGSSDSFIAKYTQGGTLLWSKTWGDAGYDLANKVTTAADGYVVVGETSLGAGNNDSYIAKFNINGTSVWNKTIGSPEYDGGFALAKASDSGYIVIGETDGYGAGNADAFIAKVDSNGVLSWNKTIGSAGYDYLFGISSTSDGGYVAAGDTDSYGTGLDDILISKHKANGTIDGCVSPMCQDISLTTANINPSINSPSATTTTPTPAISSISPGVSSPSLSTTILVSPK